jgi:hypothetical protein
VADREDEGTAPQEEPARPPLDEEAAWAALIAGYHADPDPGIEPSWPDAENVTAREDGGEEAAEPAKDPGPPPPPSRSIVVHPVISGPRNYELAEEDEDDAHFVPPEPPPLPDADVTTKFAWIAVLGGPLLLLAFILFQLDLTWWAVLLGVGGFLGGFATLVFRMPPGDEDDDRPGGGAVV